MRHVCKRAKFTSDEIVPGLKAFTLQVLAAEWPGITFHLPLSRGHVVFDGSRVIGIADGNGGVITNSRDMHFRLREPGNTFAGTISMEPD